MGKELGSRITETLQKRGMTQKELAGRIGVTEAVISRYISGGSQSQMHLQTLQLRFIQLPIFCLGLKPKNLIIREFAV